MILSDFKNVKRISVKSIMATNPDLARVHLKLLLYVDNLLHVIDNYINPICLTSGSHTGDTHGQGVAIDYTLVKPISDEQFLIACAYCGIEGIGIYWNGVCKSYHNDVGHKPKQTWCGIKKTPGSKKPDGSPNPWTYSNFVIDVKEVLV